MSFEVKIPEVGESITEVTIGSWNKSNGAHVEMNEVLCEIESDKAAFELPAEAEGELEILVEEGETVEIGTVVAKIAEGASGGNGSSSSDGGEKETSESKASSGEASEEKGETIEITVPEVGESITEVTIGSWNYSSDDQVEANDVLCEIESDKATFELPADASGTLEIVAEEGDTLEIGDVVCKITTGSGAAKSTSTGDAKGDAASGGYGDKAESGPAGDQSMAGVASPAAAKILSEKGIDPKDVQGTGKDGRITKEDAQKAEKKAPAKPEQKPAPKQKKESEAAPAPSETSGERTTERKRMSSLRKTVAKRLVSVKNDTAMLTTFNEVNMKPMMDLRKKYKEKFKEKHEIGLGFMSFFTKATALALQEFPAVNAMIDGDEMVYHNYVDVSIAVSSPRGLVVPVVRNAQNLSFAGIEKEVLRLAKKARDGKISIPEMKGAPLPSPMVGCLAVCSAHPSSMLRNLPSWECTTLWSGLSP